MSLSKSDIEALRTKGERRDRERATTWTIVMVVVFGAGGYFARPYLLENWVAAVFLSSVLFCILAYMLRQRTHGREVTGGMENGPTIAVGAVILMWFGALGAVAYHADSLFYLFGSMVLGAAGILISYYSLKEGPVYGWE